MVGLIALIGACQRAEDGRVTDTATVRDTTAVAFQECNPPGQVSEGSRADIVSWARGLSYRRADSSLGYVSGFRRTATDSMTVQVVGNSRRPRAVLRRGCLIGRITTSRADARLGLGAGSNYVWADSTTGSWRVLVFPEAGEGVRRHSLMIHNHRTSALAADSVRRPCMECEEYGWCRFPGDTARVALGVSGVRNRTTTGSDSPRLRGP